MKNLIVVLFIFFSSLGARAKTADYGLHLQTFPHPSSEFTSVALESGAPIYIHNQKTTLSFRVLNRPENVFGVVFRIITDKNCNIDLMYGVTADDKRYPQLVIGNSIFTLQNELLLNRWIDVSVTIDPKERKVSLRYGDISHEAYMPQLKKTNSLRIFFGSCSLIPFDLNNVASVNIRDIGITVKNKKIREWDMSIHHGDTCYDNIGGYIATVSNPKWLIDKHLIWRTVFNGSFEGHTSVAFDTKEAFLFITDNDDVIRFDCNDMTQKRFTARRGKSAAVYPNSLIYLDDEKMLMSYNIDQNIYSCFDFDSREWDNPTAPAVPHKEHYWNNTAIWHHPDSTLVSFGGYGHYQFNNDLVINRPWSQDKASDKEKIIEIPPRYCPSSVIVDSILYIFGGRGNLSGKQEMTQKYYYDLYACNLNTGELRKIWEFNARPTDGDFLPGNNMLYVKEDDCFYTFGQQSGGILMKIGRTDPQIATMSFPVTFSHDAQYTYTNLYFSPRLNTLFAVHLQNLIDGTNLVHLYALDYPPVMLKDETKSDTPVSAKSPIWLWTVIITLSAAAVLGPGIYIYKRRKKKPATLAVQEISKEFAEGTEIPEFHNYDFSRSCICFFGGFRVKDSEGNDITDQFTPTLKALVILLILHTGKENIGISGNKLIQTLWFDKSEESAKNNRNVYISRLRNILEKVGDVKIVNRKGFWHISMEGDVFCDYLEAQRMFCDKTNKELEKLIELLLRGVMLPNVEDEFVDQFKSDFSNTTIDLLTSLLKQSNISDRFRLKIADTLFQHDFINEDALRAKVGILYRQGKKGLAKTIYDAFCKEYQVSLGTSFNVPMLDLIK